MDIYDISLERVTTQYLDYIETFKLLNIDLASEFISMAANLMYIKSRTLLPKREQPPEDEADEDDPRWELIRQLIEYKKFKDAAGFLARREVEQESVFALTPEKRTPNPRILNPLAFGRSFHFRPHQSLPECPEAIRGGAGFWRYRR